LSTQETLRRQTKKTTKKQYNTEN